MNLANQKEKENPKYYNLMLGETHITKSKSICKIIPNHGFQIELNSLSDLFF